MTAEIAILNRTALALAADSAVTISVGNKTKVYDTAEKLFELSRSQPIALMIYNNVEFVGVPLDVLIRKFRSERTGEMQKYSTIAEAANDFLEYLKVFDHDIAEEKRYLFLVLKERFSQLFKAFLLRSRQLFEELQRGETPSVSPKQLILEIIGRENDEEAKVPLADFLTNVTLTKFRRRYADVVEQAFKTTFNGIEPDTEVLREASRLAFNIVKSRDGSDLLTGLVFGGFAENDIFPTLRYLEIDGVYFGEIKTLSCNEIDIDRKSTRAEVIPFAQKEMVERFVYGLDSELEESLRSFVASAVNEIVDTSAPDSKGEVKSAIKRKVNTRFNKTLNQLKQRSRQDLLDIVYFMSKKELAEIAYALVEITSHKRRFSTDEESVGGPIDVAIITKSEGLVWIRRKHYFTPEINETYFARVFGRNRWNNGGSHEGQEERGAAGIAGQ